MVKPFAAVTTPNWDIFEWPGTPPTLGLEAARFMVLVLRALHPAPPSRHARGMTADLLSPDDPTWIPVVSALTQLLHALVLSTAPRRIVLGGGVTTAQAHLFEKLRGQLQISLNGYVDVPELTTGIAQYIVPAALGPMAGPLGSLVLAENALLAHH